MSLKPGRQQPFEAQRTKVLNTIADGFVQKVGEMQALVLLEEDLAGLGLTLADLNDIDFKFEHVGEPEFAIRILKNKVVNCGFIKLIARSINYPANIPTALRNSINNIFFGEDGMPIPFALRLQGEMEVCGVDENAEIEEFFDFEGVAACFISLSTFSGGIFQTGIFLVVKAAVNVHIIVSRRKIATIDVSDVESVTDFDC